MSHPGLPNTGSRATILVVDDEDIVRALVERALREAVYRVVQAHNGAAALDVLESGRELLSADVRSRHRLPVASSVQSALAALVREEIVMKEQGRYVVNDSLYREWLARRTF